MLEYYIKADVTDSVSSINYDSCVSSPFYHAGMECRLMYNSWLDRTYFPFEPEINHKPYSLFPIDFAFSETISISANWDWCGDKEKIIIKTNLPNGPQRYGRSSKE